MGKAMKQQYMLNLYTSLMACIIACVHFVDYTAVLLRTTTQFRKLPLTLQVY